MKRIESAEELEQLFDEFAWFQDGSCPSLAPPPNSANTPQQVELVLRDMGTGGINAGDLRTYMTLRLVGTGVREWSFTGEAFHHAAEHCMEGVDTIDTSAGFGLTVDVPTLVRLVADVVEYERLPEVTEANPPWTIDREFSVTARRADRPSPAEWVTALATQGVDVAWRVYGGPAHPTERVPTDYTGWFLERLSRLDEHDGGVFMAYTGERAPWVAVVLERYGADDDLWLAARRTVAHMFPDGEFRSGNCRFTAAQWMDQLTHTSD